MLKRFLDHNRGAVAPLFAVAAIPVLAAAGAAIDYSHAYQERTTIQDALDAAVLAGGRLIGTKTDTQIKAEAKTFYDANIGSKVSTPPVMTMTITGGTIKGTAELHVPTYFLGVTGISEIVFNVSATAMAGMGTLEVVMALDNSGSMSGSKITTLRTAATNLTNTLFALGTTSTKVDPVKIGVVPFSAAVNVGSQYKTATWMDINAQSPVHGENFDIDASTGKPYNLFKLYTDMKNSPWKGCVEERPQPYDVTDDAPTTLASPTPAQAATLFVPMFAPDESDAWTASTTNDYLSDKGGTCSGAPTTTSSNEQAAQSRTCKYKNVDPGSGTAYGLPWGPNFMCTTPGVTPMTTTKQTVLDAVTAMGAQGATNILAGVSWGWKLLSPGIPFTEGRAYNELDNNKILVLMTDGENTYYPLSNFDKSTFGAFNYLSKNNQSAPKVRLGTSSTNSDTIVQIMNDRTVLACANAKAAGVIIYTVGFEISDQNDAARALQVLQTCASTPDKYFAPDNDSELLAAFTAIGDSITSLRVSQ